MAKPRKQIYTMDMYLKKIKDKDIRDNADVQRMAGAWKNGQINELVYTVLSEDYIPPIILGEEKSSQLWIIDGLQRSSSLMRYRYGNYKISSVMENSIIFYRSKKNDSNGNIMEDEEGNIIWENVAFDIKNKTYEELPDELKKRFNEYQIDTVIHEQCNMKRISTLIKRYNNHTSMNTAQKAFTHIDNFAKETRKISNTDFFSLSGIFSETEKINGTVERVVLESVMCMFHLDKWKTSAMNIAKYLNANSNKDEFHKLDSNVHRLEKVIFNKDIASIFTAKDTFIWLTFYNKFVDMGVEDVKFTEFLQAFKNGLRNKKVDGKLFDVIDKEGSTKDKAVIIAKLHILETLMYEFLHIKEKDLEEVDMVEFIKENVDSDISEEDLDYHGDNLKAWTVGIGEKSKINEEKNKISMLAISIYAFKNDEDCDDETMIEWFADYESRNKTYKLNQKENYLQMKLDLKKYIANRKKLDNYEIQFIH